jgi:hypothetical protein
MLMQNPTLLINEIDKKAVYKALRKVKDKCTAGTFFFISSLQQPGSACVLQVSSDLILTRKEM